MPPLPPPSLSLILPPSLSSFPFHLELPSVFSSPSPPLSPSLRRGLYVYDYDYSCSRFRRTPFTISLSISPPFYRPPNLVATFGLSNAHDAMHAARRRVAMLKVEALLSVGDDARREGNGPLFAALLFLRRGVTHRCVISRDSRYRNGRFFLSYT